MHVQMQTGTIDCTDYLGTYKEANWFLNDDSDCASLRLNPRFLDHIHNHSKNDIHHVYY